MNDVADELNNTLNLSTSESEDDNDDGIRYSLLDPTVRLRRNPPRTSYLMNRTLTLTLSDIIEINFNKFFSLTEGFPLIPKICFLNFQ